MVRSRKPKKSRKSRSKLIINAPKSRSKSIRKIKSSYQSVSPYKINTLVLEILMGKYDASKRFDTVLDTLRKHRCTESLGTGAQGQTFKICQAFSLVTKRCADCLVLKIRYEVLPYESNTPLSEYVTQQAVWNTLATTSGVQNFNLCVPKPIRLVRNCIFMELKVEYTTLNEFLSTTVVSTLQYKGWIWQMLCTFAIIRQTYPNFCHNDLHTSNIMVSTSPSPFAFQYKDLMYVPYSKRLHSICIIDFGFSNLNQENSPGAQPALEPFAFLDDNNVTLLYGILQPILMSRISGARPDVIASVITCAVSAAFNVPRPHTTGQTGFNIYKSRVAAAAGIPEEELDYERGHTLFTTPGIMPTVHEMIYSSFFAELFH